MNRFWAWHASFRLREKVLYFAVMATLAMLLYLFLRAAFPPIVLRVATHPLPLTGMVFGPSRLVVFRLDYCSEDGVAPSSVIRELWQQEQKVLVALPLSGYGLEAGCHQVHIAESIPSFVPPGTYRLRVRFMYRTNAVTEPSVLQTEVFTLP